MKHTAPQVGLEEQRPTAADLYRLEVVEHHPERAIHAGVDRGVGLGRRLDKGQQYEPPYLGMREMIADVGPAPEEYTPIDAGVDRPLGLMFYDFEPVEIGRGRPLFFEAQLRSGVLHVPPLAQVLAENGMRRAPP